MCARTAASRLLYNILAVTLASLAPLTPRLAPLIREPVWTRTRYIYNSILIHMRTTLTYRTEQQACNDFHEHNVIHDKKKNWRYVSRTGAGGLMGLYFIDM